MTTEEMQAKLAARAILDAAEEFNRYWEQVSVLAMAVFAEGKLMRSKEEIIEECGSFVDALWAARRADREAREG